MNNRSPHRRCSARHAPPYAHSKTAVVYCRTSTSGQKEAATIGAQIDRCGKLVIDHGVRLLPYGPQKNGWLQDDGVSGSLLEGRAFSALIDDLQHGRVRVDYLIVYSMSRLARHDKSSRDMSKLVKSAENKARIMAVLNGAGVKIIDGDGVNDPASVLTETKETLSGEEYRSIRRRTMDGKHRKPKDGAWATGGRVPYGYPSHNMAVSRLNLDGRFDGSTESKHVYSIRFESTGPVDSLNGMSGGSVSTESERRSRPASINSKYTSTPAGRRPRSGRRT